MGLCTHPDQVTFTVVKFSWEYIPVQWRIRVGQVVMPRGLADANLPIDNSILSDGQLDLRLRYSATYWGRIDSNLSDQRKEHST